jgi:hypothetical protein
MYEIILGWWSAVPERLGNTGLYDSRNNRKTVRETTSCLPFCSRCCLSYIRISWSYGRWLCLCIIGIHNTSILNIYRDLFAWVILPVLISTCSPSFIIYIMQLPSATGKCFCFSRSEEKKIDGPNLYNKNKY